MSDRVALFIGVAGAFLLLLHFLPSLFLGALLLSPLLLPQLFGGAD